MPGALGFGRLVEIPAPTWHQWIDLAGARTLRKVTAHDGQDGGNPMTRLGRLTRAKSEITQEWAFGIAEAEVRGLKLADIAETADISVAAARKIVTEAQKNLESSFPTVTVR